MAESNDIKDKHLNIPLNGRWRPAVDGTQLGQGDFQTLTNMRYDELSPKSILGMTKINANVINSSYKPIRGAFHFRKDQPAESHILAQVWNNALTSSYKVYENITAVPNAGDFGSALFTDTAGAGRGRFSNAPDNCVAYANGKDTCVWPGDEGRVAGFVIGDLDGNTNLDYTLQINNTLTDDANVATITSVTETINPNTSVLLHLDNNLTDSSGKSHDGIASAPAVGFSSSICKWGYAAGPFNGTTHYIKLTDHADFHLSGGIWTVDAWVRPDFSGSAKQIIYYKMTAVDTFMSIHLDKSGSSFTVTLHIQEGGADKILLTTTSLIPNLTWSHVEVVENGNDYYIFLNGVMSAYVSSANRPLNYTGDIYICTNSAGGNSLKGYLDELEVLKGTARHTSDFSIRSYAYGAQTTCYLYIGSVLPAKGFKFYMVSGSENASASVLNVSQWYAGTWHSVTNMVDGTDTAGVTLSKTGTVSFDTTVPTAKPKLLNDTYIYWYLFTFLNVDSTTKISHCTLISDFQKVVDLWDNEYRPIASFFKYTTKYIDNTTNVLNKDWVAPGVDDATGTQASLTFSNIAGLTSSQYLLAGFVERQTGLKIEFVQAGYGTTSLDRTNGASCTIAIQYWDGQNWVSVSGIDDGTRQGNASFGKSGAITWDAPAENTEFRYSVKKNIDHFYYYKISFSATLVGVSAAAAIYVDQIQGIPAQKHINGYSFPAMWQNRLWYFDEVGDKRNSGICTSQDTVVVFNGQDGIGPEAPMLFGNNEKVVCAESLYTRYGGTQYDNLIVYKANETWVIDGTSPTDYRKFKMGDSGCVAPGTLKKCNSGYEMAPGLLHHVHIFQSDHGIHINDGNTIQTISDDIENYFDRTKSECISAVMIDKSEAFFDEANIEYHWLFASGSDTTLNMEFVFDVRKKKWYKIDRVVTKNIQLGITVADTKGNSYNYGFLDAGFMLRLEYGTTMDSVIFTSGFKTGDISLGDWRYLTKIKKLKHIALSKATCTYPVTITHYGDCINTAPGPNVTHSLVDSTHRITRKVGGVNWGNYLFHSIECSIPNYMSVQYEPIGLEIKYQQIHDEEF